MFTKGILKNNHGRILKMIMKKILAMIIKRVLTMITKRIIVMIMKNILKITLKMCVHHKDIFKAPEVLQFKINKCCSLK